MRVAEVNRSTFGLQAGVFTDRLEHALHAFEARVGGDHRQRRPHLAHRQHAVRRRERLRARPRGSALHDRGNDGTAAAGDQPPAVSSHLHNAHRQINTECDLETELRAGCPPRDRLTEVRRRRAIWRRDIRWGAQPGSADAKSIETRLGWLDVGDHDGAARGSCVQALRARVHAEQHRAVVPARHGRQQPVRRGAATRVRHRATGFPELSCSIPPTSTR